MKVLITGGCGFIGTNLVKYLADKGYRIRILDNLSVGKEENLRKLQNQDSRLSNVDLMIGDIRSRDAVSQAVKDMDVVVHLAAHTSVVESLKNPEEDWDVNINGTINLLEACRQNGVNRFVFASSNAAVGEQTPPINEMRVPRPLSPYGASKLAGEALCSAQYNSFGLKTVALRFANCYGPHSAHKTSIIARFIKLVKEEKPLVIYGDGNQTRDFVHTDDICQAIYLAATAAQQTNGDLYDGVFQVGTGIETSINEFTKLVKEISGNRLQISHEAERKGEIIRNYSDISKAKRVLGFEPQIGLKEGLKTLWKWYTEVTR
jgi:UDP-glucose 4-epimerase